MRPRLASIFTVVCLAAILAGCGGGGGGSNGPATKPIDPVDPSPNQAPSITSIAPESSSIAPIQLKVGERQSITVSASDPDNDALSYTWSVEGGSIEEKTSQNAVFVAPASPGAGTVTISVSDGKEHTVSAKVYFQVGSGGAPVPQNAPPTVSVQASVTEVAAGGEVTFTASASDPDGDALTYSWISNAGSIKTDNHTNVVWTAPNALGTYSVTVVVSDNNNPGVSASASISVGGGSGPGFTNGLNAKYYKKLMAT